MQLVRCNFDSRRSRARFDQSEGRRDIASRISEYGKKWRGSLDVEKQDGVRVAVEWRKSRQSRKRILHPTEEEEERKGTGNARLPLSTSGTDRKWRRARLAHNSV